MFLVKVKEESESLVTKSDTLRYFNNLVEAISHCGNTLGKDGRFQVFVCLALRYVCLYLSSLLLITLVLAYDSVKSFYHTKFIL